MVLFIRVPYYVGDLKRDPNLGNYLDGFGVVLSRESTT